MMFVLRALGLRQLWDMLPMRGIMSNYENGADDVREILMRLEQHAIESAETQNSLLKICDERLGEINLTIDKFADALIGRKMMPIDSLKYILIFVGIFTFAVFFGVEAVAKIGEWVRGLAG